MYDILKLIINDQQYHLTVLLNKIKNCKCVIRMKLNGKRLFNSCLSAEQFTRATIYTYLLLFCSSQTVIK